ncbi:methyltransferase domain-containing protein [Paenalkalicoccus suaedae]|uniref:Methyltransferase domain-containing protein n=1 Tax=Paenalkalicoccus suaedae TaxID=2592382 RepID=A0A859FH06_9BACI|nr:class I SAM-dependent methyltransferase [Paenalkalicoccus suaedae]QKS71495.1 methyltransferase domain-containing protein [Paenalkalicoccus suaedae]
MRKFSAAEFDSRTEFFDEMAQTSWLSAIHEEVIAFGGDLTQTNIVDIGCGTGRLLMRAKSLASSLTGIDLSEKMIEKATSLFGEHATFLVGDATDLPLDDSVADVSYTTCLLFLLPHPEESITEQRRILRSGGLLVTLNPSPQLTTEQADVYANKHHLSEGEADFLRQWARVAERRHQFTPKSLQELLEKHGFSDVETRFSSNGLGMMTKAILA